MSRFRSEQIHEYRINRSETEWLELFEFLRLKLGEALNTTVHLGCYWIDDMVGHASTGACATVRGHGAVPGVESDTWEGVLCWSGSRAKQCGWASVLVFPFLRGSILTRRGRVIDQRPAPGRPVVEVDEFLNFRFDEDRFNNHGWMFPEGPGEWAGVAAPGSIYYKRLLHVTPPAQPIAAGSPLHVELRISDLSSIPATPAGKNAARISLVHVNRNREGTNLTPWTAQPTLPKSPDVQSLADCQIIAPNIVRVRLDKFRIRGGWTPGKYYFALRAQNFHQQEEWSWSGDVSEPVEMTIA